MATKLIFYLTGCLLFVSVTQGAGILARHFLGSNTKQEQWECIKGYNVTKVAIGVFDPFAIPPEFTCHVSETANDISLAQKAGFQTVDGVISTDAKYCYKSASWIYSDIFSYLQKNKVDIGNIWLDISDDNIGATNWKSPQENIDYIQSLVDEGKKRNHNVGIMTTPRWWKQITGDTTKFSTLPLMYDDFSQDFTPFGGWTTPTLKPTPRPSDDSMHQYGIYGMEKRVVCGYAQFFLYDMA